MDDPRFDLRGFVVGHFKLTDFIKRGGEGDVWKCVKVESADIVAAAKVIEISEGEESRIHRYERWLNEIQTLYKAGSQGNEDCVIRYLNSVAMQQVYIDKNKKLYNLDDPSLHDAMDDARLTRICVAITELCTPGFKQNLFHSSIAKRDPLTALQKLLGVAKALHSLHEQGLLHCDLKPSNLLLCGDKLKLADFGFAKQESESNAIGLTYAYAAPELLKGSPHSRATDIYSFGLTIYELLTGNYALKLPSQPHPNPSQQVLFWIDVHANVETSDLLANVDYEPVRLSRLISSMTNKDPKKRKGLKELIDAIEFELERPRCQISSRDPKNGLSWKGLPDYDSGGFEEKFLINPSARHFIFSEIPVFVYFRFYNHERLKKLIHNIQKIIWRFVGRTFAFMEVFGHYCCCSQLWVRSLEEATAILEEIERSGYIDEMECGVCDPRGSRLIPELPKAKATRVEGINQNLAFRTMDGFRQLHPEDRQAAERLGLIVSAKRRAGHGVRVWMGGVLSERAQRTLNDLDQAYEELHQKLSALKTFTCGSLYRIDHRSSTSLAERLQPRKQAKRQLELDVIVQFVAANYKAVSDVKRVFQFGSPFVPFSVLETGDYTISFQELRDRVFFSDHGDSSMAREFWEKSTES